MILGLEDALAFLEAGLDLRVARQRARCAHGESLGRLALGEPEVGDAVLDHEPGRLLGELLAKARRSRTVAALLSHRPDLPPRRPAPRNGR